MSATRIAVTGIGLVTALGGNQETTFTRLMLGHRGFRDITGFDTSGQKVRIGAEVPDFRPEDVAPRGGAAWSRGDAFALVAAREAWDDSGRRASGPEPRLGIAVGVTAAGMLEAEEFLARLGEDAHGEGAAARLSSYPISSTASRLAEVFAPVQRLATLCSACSSSANAIVQGASWLELGVADVVLAGGADALCRLTLTGFNSLGATDAEPCRPFDAARRGLTLGEGAAFLVLETEAAARSRGARVLAYLSGWAVGAEAHHITQPEPSARMPARLLRHAIANAGLEPSDVDYVNAHGTGTVSNDVAESAAIRAVFGDHVARVLVSSSKGQIGHTLGAAGAIEAAITVLAVSKQRVPPTGGLVRADEACGLNHVVGQGKSARLKSAVTNSFGFGGTGAVLLFEHADSVARRPATPGALALSITGISTIGASGVLAGGQCAENFSAAPGEPKSVRALDLLDPSRSRRFDAHAALVTLGAETALRTAELAPLGVGLVAGTAFGSVERAVAFIHTFSEKGPRRVPPAEFPHLVPSAASGNAAIYLGLTGPVVTTSELDASAEAAVALAAESVESGNASAMIAGGAEPTDAIVTRVLGPVCVGAPDSTRSAGAAWVVLEPFEAAKRRGARIFAVLKARYEFPLELILDARVPPPLDPARAILAVARDPACASALLARSGWGAVPVRSVARATGFHEAAGGVALAAAAASIFAGGADEALVVGFTATRLHLFHLVSPR